MHAFIQVACQIPHSIPKSKDYGFFHRFCLFRLHEVSNTQSAFFLYLKYLPNNIYHFQFLLKSPLM